MKKFRVWLLIIISTILVYFFEEDMRGMAWNPVNWKSFLMIGLLMTVSAWLHSRKAGVGYGRRLLTGGIPDAMGRIIYMDYLRVLATVFVIAVHVLESTYKQNFEPHSFGWETMAVLASVCLSCNVIFMMLSGALLLNEKEESLSSFYQKRASKVLIPCLAYFLFYSFYVDGLAAFYPENWERLAREFLSNGNGMTPHFWLIYVILMFYIAAPFFRVMMCNLSDRMLSAFMVAIFMIHIAYTYAPCLNITPAASTYLASMESMFILGYYCVRNKSEKSRRVLMAGGGLSVLLMIVTIHSVDHFDALLYNTAPPMMLLSCAIFLFFKKHGDTWFRRMAAPLAVVSKHSFSILMIHYLIMFDVVYDRMGLSGVDFGIVGGVLGCILVTLALSLAFALVFDHTVVFCIDALFHKMTDRWVR